MGLSITVCRKRSLTIAKNHAQFTLEVNLIKSVDSFTYPGSQIAYDGAREDVNLRLRMTQHAFMQLNNIGGLNQLSLNTKLEVFNTPIKLCLRRICRTF